MEDKETQEEIIEQVTPLLNRYILTQIGQAFKNIVHILSMKTIVEKGKSHLVIDKVTVMSPEIDK